MLTITDSGCQRHQPCQITFNGIKAAMVERLISNLPKSGEYYTYICEHGYTHNLIFHLPKQEVATFTPAHKGLTREGLSEFFA